MRPTTYKRLCRRRWVAAAFILLCSCGQSGDLYLPPDAPAESSKQK